MFQKIGVFLVFCLTVFGIISGPAAATAPSTIGATTAVYISPSQWGWKVKGYCLGEGPCGLLCLCKKGNDVVPPAWSHPLHGIKCKTREVLCSKIMPTAYFTSNYSVQKSRVQRYKEEGWDRGERVLIRLPEKGRVGINTLRKER